MDDFKKFFEELPDIAQKVRMATETISRTELTSQEKEMTLFRLMSLRDAANSIIQQLQHDLNSHAGEMRITRTYAAETSFRDKLGEVKDILDAVFCEGTYAHEEDGDDVSAYEGNNEN